MSLFSLFLLHFLSADTTYNRDDDGFIGVVITEISDQSFQNSIVNCTSTGSCIISCEAYLACKNVTINCYPGDVCEVECTVRNSCQDVIINGPTAASLEVNCEMEQSCLGATINGANDSSISVDCGASYGCVDTVINGAEHSSIIMECNQMYGCVNAVINASDSTSFLLSGCSDYMSCIGMTIACPPNIDGVPQCNFISMYSTSFTSGQSEEIEFPIIFHSELISR